LSNTNMNLGTVTVGSTVNYPLVVSNAG
jgi:hypothetical protein